MEAQQAKKKMRTFIAAKTENKRQTVRNTAKTVKTIAAFFFNKHSNDTFWLTKRVKQKIHGHRKEKKWKQGRWRADEHREMAKPIY